MDNFKKLLDESLLEEGSFGTLYFTPKSGKLSAGGAKSLRDWLTDDERNSYMTVESANIVGDILAIEPYGSGGGASKFIKAIGDEFGLKLVKSTHVL